MTLAWHLTVNSDSSPDNKGVTMLVQTEALTRALKLLTAAGVQYAVIDAEGVKHGTLEIAVTPPP